LKNRATPLKMRAVSGILEDERDALEGMFPQLPPVESDVEAQRQFHRVSARLFGGAPEPVMLGRWEVGELIDAGGMGFVYRAYDPRLQRHVAIKAMQLGLGTDIERRRQRMLREAQAMARITHPNVIHVYDVEVSDAQIFLVMELVAGQSLSAWLQSGERSWSEILAVFLDAGEGLAASHAVKVVHRDFKPDNVLIDPRGHVKVIDFGLAFVPEARKAGMLRDGSPLAQALTADGVVIGTLNYMAPEQLRGELADTSALSDQYSFCRALFESLYQSRPFHGSTIEALLAAMEAEELDFGYPPRHVPRRLRKVLRRGLAARPGRRYPSMSVLLAELRAARQPTGAWLFGGVLALALGVGLGAVLTEAPMQERCGVVATRQQIWGEARKADVARAVQGLPIPRAEETWARVDQRMSGHVGEWAQRSETACAVGSSMGPVAACLVDHGVKLAALSEALTRPTPDLVTNIDVMLLDLDEQLQRCQLAPPGGAAPRSEGSLALHVRGSFARAWVEELSGRLFVARAEALAARQDALTLGDRSLVAEAELRLGRVLGRMHDAAGYQHLEAARQIGMETGELMITIDAGIFLIKFAADVLEDPGLAERSAELLDAILIRTGSPRSRRAQLLDSRGLLAQAREQYAEAAALHEQAWASLREVLDAASPELLRIELNRVNALSRVRPPGVDAARPVALHLDLLRRAEAALGRSHSLTFLIRYSTAGRLFEVDDLGGAEVQAGLALQAAQFVFGPDSRAVASCEVLLGRIAEQQEDFVRATVLAQQAMAHWEAIERREGRVYTNTFATIDLQASLALRRGDHGNAVALFDRGAAMATKGGLRAQLQALEFTSNAAYVLLDAHLFAEAIPRLEALKGQVERQELQATQLGVEVLGNLGIAQLGLGDADSAVVSLTGALEGVTGLVATMPELAELRPLYEPKLEEARRLARR
jgi:tetratricopeptide (TPR) repeat protein